MQQKQAVENCCMATGTLGLVQLLHMSLARSHSSWGATACTYLQACFKGRHERTHLSARTMSPQHNHVCYIRQSTQALTHSPPPMQLHMQHPLTYRARYRRKRSETKPHRLLHLLSPRLVMSTKGRHSAGHFILTTVLHATSPGNLPKKPHSQARI